QAGDRKRRRCAQEGRRLRHRSARRPAVRAPSRARAGSSGYGRLEVSVLRVVIARSEATKQSRSRCTSPWIASLRSQWRKSLTAQLIAQLLGGGNRGVAE